jgi:hypothetical protein
VSQEPTDPAGQEPKQDPPEDGDPKAGQEPEPKTFDAEYVQKLRAEAAKYRTEAQEAKTKVQEFEDRDKTEQQKKDEKAAEAEQRATVAESKALRFEVAAANDIPLKHAHRLVGSTKQELEKDAAELSKELTAGPPDFGSGVRHSAPAGDDMNARLRQAAGRG